MNAIDTQNAMEYLNKWVPGTWTVSEDNEVVNEETGDKIGGSYELYTLVVYMSSGPVATTSSSLGTLLLTLCARG